MPKRVLVLDNKHAIRAVKKHNTDNFLQFTFCKNIQELDIEIQNNGIPDLVLIDVCLDSSDGLKPVTMEAVNSLFSDGAFHHEVPSGYGWYLENRCKYAFPMILCSAFDYVIKGLDKKEPGLYKVLETVNMEEICSYVRAHKVLFVSRDHDVGRIADIITAILQ